eukprot:7371860-Pyramimonas_sp.AAC.1
MPVASTQWRTAYTECPEQLEEGTHPEDPVEAHRIARLTETRQNFFQSTHYGLRPLPNLGKVVSKRLRDDTF